MSMLSFKACGTSFAVIFYPDKIGLVHGRGENTFGTITEVHNWIVKNFVMSEAEKTRILRILKNQ